MAIAEEDLQGFKDIKKDLGEQVDSAVTLDKEDEDKKNSDDDMDEADNLKMNIERINSMASSEIEDEETLFLKKLGINPDDARPTGAQVHKALKYFDLGIKIEVVLVSKIIDLNFIVRTAINTSKHIYYGVGLLHFRTHILFTSDLENEKFLVIFTSFC